MRFDLGDRIGNCSRAPAHASQGNLGTVAERIDLEPRGKGWLSRQGPGQQLIGLIELIGLVMKHPSQDVADGQPFRPASGRRASEHPCLFHLQHRFLQTSERNFGVRLLYAQVEIDVLSTLIRDTASPISQTVQASCISPLPTYARASNEAMLARTSGSTSAAASTCICSR